MTGRIGIGSTCPSAPLPWSTGVAPPLADSAEAPVAERWMTVGARVAATELLGPTVAGAAVESGGTVDELVDEPQAASATTAAGVISQRASAISPQTIAHRRRFPRSCQHRCRDPALFLT